MDRMGPSSPAASAAGSGNRDLSAWRVRHRVGGELWSAEVFFCGAECQKGGDPKRRIELLGLN